MLRAETVRAETVRTETVRTETVSEETVRAEMLRVEMLRASYCVCVLLLPPPYQSNNAVFLAFAFEYDDVALRVNHIFHAAVKAHA